MEINKITNDGLINLPRTLEKLDLGENNIITNHGLNDLPPKLKKLYLK
jgi:hypothetical protein